MGHASSVFPASTLEGFLEIQGPGFGMSLAALVTGEKSHIELPVPFHAAGCAHAPGQLCWVLMDPTGQRGILQPLPAVLSDAAKTFPPIQL